MRGLSSAVSALLGAALIALMAANPLQAVAMAESCATWSTTLRVVGVPEFDEGRGALDVSTGSLTRGTRDSVTLALLGQGQPVVGARFGAALSTFFAADGDDCLDLAVGAPGAESTGVVYVLHGSAGGFREVEAVRLPSGEVGDDFGWSVATFDSGVWAGAPGRDVAGTVDAGAVAVFGEYKYGEQVVRSSAPIVVTQDSPKVPGAPEKGDRFGEVLAPYWTGSELSFPAVLVGVPREDVGKAVNAGVVAGLMWQPQGVRPSGYYHQNDDHTPGVAETGDHFGAAIAVGSQYPAAIGAPGEDIGRIRDAGTVTLLAVNDADGNCCFGHQPVYSINQDSERVPGSAEAGDQFGAAIATTPYCRGHAGFAVGAPSEDVGRLRDAGQVALIDAGIHYFSPDVTPRPRCDGLWVQQGGLAPGHAEQGDRFGSQLAVRGDFLYVAAPAEDIGTSVDAGVVAAVHLKPSIHRGEQRTLYPGPRNGLHYGVLPTQ